MLNQYTKTIKTVTLSNGETLVVKQFDGSFQGDGMHHAVVVLEDGTRFETTGAGTDSWDRMEQQLIRYCQSRCECRNRGWILAINQDTKCWQIQRCDKCQRLATDELAAQVVMNILNY